VGNEAPSRVRRVLSLADNVLLVVVLGAGGAWGYHVISDRQEPALKQQRDLPPASSSEAFEPLEALAALEVKGRAPSTGYDRKLFGVGAVDLDRNGCDYRNDVLRRDLTVKVVRPGTPACVVERGSFNDPYTGDPVSFVRGTNPSAIEVDHIVPLADAWQKGAQQWSPDKRVQFGNDPRNLLAVSRQANRAKKDGDAATWLPPDTRFRCTYVSQQIAVKAAYGLSVTPAERDAMERVLRRCS
jgi:hypothetical protein